MMLYHKVLIQPSELSAQFSKPKFLDPQPIVFDEDGREEKIQENLVYQITRQPGNLLCHLRRIYACYQQDRSEQLYAALIDLLTVLEKKGQSLSRRVVYAAGKKLNREQFELLRDYLAGDEEQHRLDNDFTVLVQELIGRQHLLDKEPVAKSEHDCMQLAQDYIEYSQLDEALAVLEQGLSETPDREDIQGQLLELYKVTGDEARFRKAYDQAKQNQYDLIPGWIDLEHYFDERST